MRSYFNWEQICADEDVRLRSNGIIFFFVIAFISLIMVCINIATQTINLLIVTSVLFVFCSIFSFLALKCSTRGYTFVMAAACFLIILMSAYFLYSGGTEGFSVIWLCLFPLIGYMVLKRSIARFFNICLLLMVYAALLTPLHAMLGYSYSQTFRYRFPVVMTFGFLGSWVSELVRSQTQKRLVGMKDTFREYARKDPLTGAGNRNAFSEDIKIAAGFGNVSFALIDIDFFKQVNDTFGHDTGDYVLKTVSDILVGNVRPTDRVYRWGGEEFLIAMPDITPADFTCALQRLRTLIENHEFNMPQQGTQLNVTISAGGASGCSSTVNAQGAIKLADECMYSAKQQGRNRVITKSFNNIA